MPSLYQIKKTTFICHDPLSQKSSFTKENMGYAKKKKIFMLKTRRNCHTPKFLILGCE